MKITEPEKEFDLTWRDFPNFRRTPGIGTLEELRDLIEENKLKKAWIDRLKMEHDVA